MKFLTPDLLARFQSEDETTALRAHDEWEEAGERYHVELDSIRNKLPANAVSLMDRFFLHDARVVWVGSGDGALVFVLMLDGDGGGLQLEYDLAEPATLTPHPELAEDSPLEWLYDEFTLAGDAAVFVHSILFTDGSELRLAVNALRWRHFPRARFGGAAPVRLAELVAA